jgi:hypothetical protein
MGDRETWASLPVLFWRVSLAALSSREPGERLGDPSPGTPPASLKSADATLLPGGLFLASL